MWSRARWLLLLIAVAAAGCSSPVPPGPPSAVAVVAGDEQATVTWEAPARGAGSVVEYLVLGEPGAIRRTVPASRLADQPLSAQLSGLTNGVEYTFTVTAIQLGNV